LTANLDPTTTNKKSRMAQLVSSDAALGSAAMDANYLK
jgi:hypothetical protein